MMQIRGLFIYLRQQGRGEGGGGAGGGGRNIKKKTKKKPLAGRATKGGDSARRMAGCGSEPRGGGKSP